MSTVPKHKSAARRIERFLRRHPDGRLIVCVATASPAGLAWLHEHTVGRPVELLVGDLRRRHFVDGTRRQRLTARKFADRGDVKIRHWPRRTHADSRRRKAHLKLWAVCDGDGNPAVFLVGSANLTTAGLHDNVEAVAVADRSEHAYLSGVVSRLHSGARPSRRRLRKAIAA